MAWLQDAILSAREKDEQEARRRRLIALGGCTCGSGARLGECPRPTCDGPLVAAQVNKERAARMRDLLRGAWCACNDHDTPTPCRCEPVKKASDR
jgi:hypothetical protein